MSTHAGARHLEVRGPYRKTQRPGEDILRGAANIAEFLLGSSDQRRKVYYLADIDVLPVFRLGSSLCARKSTLLRWIAEQENSANRPSIR